MACYGTDLQIERAFWSYWGIDWDNVEAVQDWYKFSDYWSRRVDYKPNSYGDTPYMIVRAVFKDGEAKVWQA